jgi:hypothetical protein
MNHLLATNCPGWRANETGALVGRGPELAA